MAISAPSDRMSCVHNQMFRSGGSWNALSKFGIKAAPISIPEATDADTTSTAVFSIAGIVTRTAEESFSLYIDRSNFDYVWYRLHVCGLKNLSGYG